jgi:hypothetical protein
VTSSFRLTKWGNSKRVLQVKIRTCFHEHDADRGVTAHSSPMQCAEVTKSKAAGEHRNSNHDLLPLAFTEVTDAPRSSNYNQVSDAVQKLQRRDTPLKGKYKSDRGGLAIGRGKEERSSALIIN